MPARALARVNLAALKRNVARLRDELRGATELCAVVKGNGYGHGAVACAEAALAGGATRLAVATAGEAVELRDAGVSAPVLVMGALTGEELSAALDASSEVVAWTPEFVAALAAAAHRDQVVNVHVKLDTGMGRLGTRDPAEALEVAERIAAGHGPLRLAGVMTHLATAGEDPEFVAAQLDRFTPVVEQLRPRFPGIQAHAANSAATLTEPRSHFDFVRCGIAVYGCDPMNEDPLARRLEPVLELTSYVAAVKAAAPGDSVGYGRTFIAREPTWIATVPIGYADGIRRGLSNNCDVLVGGRTYPLVGTVSMDNVTVDLGPQPSVSVGETVTIIGTQSEARQTTEELARRIATINYEIVTGVSARVPRVYHRDGEPA
ncbi:MAG TPA: alanine racemase [Solirubrobacteraceae bacterium]|nr:alanine racemase [Solirubrobacteraceae bacterium]